MGYENMSLPIIDLSKVSRADLPMWESTKIRIGEALQEYGCFEATINKIPPQLRKSISDGIQQVFDLSLETKKKNTAEKPFSGYAGQQAGFQLYESMGIHNILSPGKIDSFINLMWPQGNPSFSKNLQFYSEKLSEVSEMVRRMVLESIGLEKYIEENINSTNYDMRIQKYAPPPYHDTEIGLIPHTDKGFVTIVHTLNQVAGLEVLSKDGKNWISARPPSPNSFLAWTNGRLHPPIHRVLMTGEETRYSMAFFANPKPSCIIKAPDEMVDEEHPLLFKPYNYAKFIEFFYTDAGKASKDLVDYCGA